MENKLKRAAGIPPKLFFRMGKFHICSLVYYLRAAKTFKASTQQKILCACTLQNASLRQLPYTGSAVQALEFRGTVCPYIFFDC